MRSKMALCRVFVALLLGGLTFLIVNMLLLWNQTPSQQCPLCNCPGHQDHSSPLSSNPPAVDIRRVVDPPSLEAYQESQKRSPEPVNQRTNNLIRLLNKTRQQQLDQGDAETQHQLAVIVPFRNRYEEMMEFVPHIHRFLDRQSVRHKIWIINQADAHRFNRASLLNIGFMLSKNECDYMVMHDIDLLPLNDLLEYRYPAEGPLHISSPELHPLYHYKKFVGGILSMTREQFTRVNGLSNLFWGWGREDDELYVRMKEAGMTVQYPQGIKTGYQTFRHIHDKAKRPRDQKRYHNQWEMSSRRDRRTGLNTLTYTKVSDLEITISGAPFHFVSVELDCDYKLTPFCDNPS